MGDWIDWRSHAASLLISGPIFAFGYAAGRYHLAWAVGAVAWHLGAGFVFSMLDEDEEA